MEYGQGVGLGYRWRVEEWRCGRERAGRGVMLLHAIHCCSGHDYYCGVSGVEDGLARSLQVSALLIPGRDLIWAHRSMGEASLTKNPLSIDAWTTCLTWLSRECLGDRRVKKRQGPTRQEQIDDT